MIFHIIVTFSAIVVRSRCYCDFSRVQILCSMSVARQIIVNHDTVSTKVSTPHTHLSLFHKQSSGNSSSRKKQWLLLTTCWSYRAASCFLTARMALPESCITTNGKKRSLHRSLSVRTAGRLLGWRISRRRSCPITLININNNSVSSGDGQFYRR